MFDQELIDIPDDLPKVQLDLEHLTQLSLDYCARQHERDQGQLFKGWGEKRSTTGRSVLMEIAAMDPVEAIKKYMPLVASAWEPQQPDRGGR